MASQRAGAQSRRRGKFASSQSRYFDYWPTGEHDGAAEHRSKWPIVQQLFASSAAKISATCSLAHTETKQLLLLLLLLPQYWSRKEPTATVLRAPLTWPPGEWPPLRNHFEFRTHTHTHGQTHFSRSARRTPAHSAANNYQPRAAILGRQQPTRGAPGR